jgi:hypothetical protein
VVSDTVASNDVAPSLEVGRIYSWDELAAAFGFAAKLFQVAAECSPDRIETRSC